MDFIGKNIDFKFSNIELGNHFCSFLRKSHLHSGGGGRSGKGGSNGSDGEGEYGGKGSGLDVSEILLETFVLSPGDGGEPNGNSGGGGGGVFVNGFGPDSSEYEGKGYGGGGYYSNDGLPGVLLLEVRPK